MTTAITLASTKDASKLIPLIAAFHTDYGIEQTEETREAAIAPLLAGSPLGAAWLIGPAMAPTGYVIITFSWSMKLGGMEAFVEELFIRPPVRKRGIASEVLAAVAASLSDAGIKALHLEVGDADETTQRLYSRANFTMRDTYNVMTRTL